MTAFLILKKFKTLPNLGIVFFTIVQPKYLPSETTVRKIVKLDQIEHFGLSKKAAVVSNFCLIGKIHRNFLVPKMIELGCKQFHAYSDPRSTQSDLLILAILGGV